jgi:GT2 family glycosyltransferase
VHVFHQGIGDDCSHAERFDLAGARRVLVVDDERVAKVTVATRDAHARRLDAEVTEHAVCGAAHGGARDQVADAHDVPVRSNRFPNAGHRENRRDRKDRIRRTDHDHVGVAQRVEHPGRGPGGIGTVESHGPDRGLATLPHEPFFERELDIALGRPGRDPCRHDVVAHRDQPAGQTPGGRDVGGDRGERLAGAQPLGAVEVGREVPVADVEPGGYAVPLERAERGERLIREPPAGLRIVRTGEGIGDGVEVGTDAQAVEPVVIGRVADDDDIERVHDLEEAGQESGRADAARQCRDHAPQSRHVRVSAPPPWFARPRSLTGSEAVLVLHDRLHKDADGTLTCLMSGVSGVDGIDARRATLMDDDFAEPLALYPPVVAVVVTRNPGAWFERTLAGMAAQDYPDLKVLVVDCGSETDPTERVAAHLPGAFVRRLDASAGFAAAANEALRVVESASFVLLCHDDVVADQSAVRLLVEEAYRSNAGIVGPKLVSADDPDLLLEVGRAIDRFGAPYTGIEPGEVDQEQHDGVRDVFYVTTAMMLVRVDLFRELGGFDPATFPGAEDLDLCWRARLVGARVLVAPDARASHREAAEQRRRADRPNEITLARSRVRVLLTSYSFLTLLWVIPFGIVVAFVEALGDLVTGHPHRARASVSAWVWNMFHLRRLRASRRQAQALRKVRDRELRALQVGSFTRLSGFVAHRLHADDRLRALGDRGRSAVGTVSDNIRGPAVVAFAGFLVIVLVGSRDFMGSGVPGIGTLVPWPGIGDLFEGFTSAWRYTGLGSASAPPPLLALMGSLGAVLLGAVSLARTVLVVAAMPIGAIGAYRFTRRLVVLRGPALAAGLAYGVNPVARNAIATGRFGPLMLFALLPFVLSRVVGLARLDADVAATAGSDMPTVTDASGPAAPRTRPRGRFLRFAVLVAFAAACYPVAPALIVLAAAAFLLAAPFARGLRASLRAVALATVGAIAAAVLLFPWPLAYAKSDLDAASLGFAYRPDLDLGAILRFQVGPSGAGWMMWGLIVAAAAPLFLATGARLSWAARGWTLAVVGWAIVWVPEQVAPDRSMLAPEAGLTLAALGLAVALGVGASVLVDGMRHFRFGWRQPAAIVGGIALLLPMIAFTADAFDGRWHAPTSGWVDTLAFTDSLTTKGQFRILWLGDPSVLPLDPVVLPDGTAYTLTRDGPGDSTEALRAPEDDADHIVDRAVELARDGLTDRLGRLLAPMGVRWVALSATQGPGGGVAPQSLPGWRRALDGQLDLARLRAPAGLRLYENLAWIPVAASVPRAAADAVPVGSVDPIRAALATDLPAAHPLPSSGTTPRGVVLWGEAYDSAWEANASGRERTLPHFRAFGWENGYRLTRPASVSLSFTDQWQRWALLGASVLIWLVVAWRWWRTRIRWAPPATASRVERARSPRHDASVDDLDDDKFWWERV